MSKQGVPPPPNGTGDTPSWVGNDKLAKQEAKFWPDETALKGQNNKNQMMLLQVYGWVVAALMIVFVFSFTITLIFWACHYLLPTAWHWLTPEQLAKIQSVIFSGSIGAIATAVVQNQLIKK